MFEDMTQETILEEMIREASDEVSVIEGSFLYNALSLAAVALEDAYDDAEAIIQNAFPDTCDREHLLRFAQTKQMAPYPATAARYVVSCTGTPEEGATLTDGERNFIVSQTDGEIIVDCEDAGADGNSVAVGTELSAVDYIEGFESATVLRLFTSGEDAEETEAFRARYIDALNVVGMYGNKKTYENLLRSYGVTGPTYIYASGTHVYISYLEEDGSIPDEDSFTAVMNRLTDDAPLGRQMVSNRASVTAKTATATFSKTSNELTDEQARARIAEKLNDYFEKLCAEHFDEDMTIWPATLTAAVMGMLNESDGIEMVSFSAIGGSSGAVTKSAGAMWTSWTVTSA